MRPIAVIASLLLLVAAGSTMAGVQGPADLGALTEALAKTLPAGDVSAVSAAATKDFQFTDIFGRTGPAGQWGDRFKAVLTMAKDPMVAAGPAISEVKGDSALVVLKLKVTGVGKDRTGDEGPLDMTVVYRTDWVKEGGAWKMKAAREVRFDGTTNRRPLSFSKTPAEEEARKGFQSMYGAISEIYEKRDWEKIEKGIADDFEIHDLEGKKLSKAELLDRVKAGTTVVTNPIVTLDPQQVAFDGDKLYVIRVMKLIGDAQLPGGKTGRVSYVNVARDTFIKSGKDWKPKASDELHAEATLDKIPIPLSLISGKP